MLGSEWYASTWDEVWNRLRDVRSKVSDSGALLLQPYSNSTQWVRPTCRKTIGDYKVMIYKVWGGNGFGHDSSIYIWNTKTNVAKYTTYGDRFTDIVKRMEQLLSHPA